jgi:hypothetical protein
VNPTHHRMTTYPWLYVLRLSDGGIKFGVSGDPAFRFKVIGKATPIVWAHLLGRARRDGSVCMAERACLRAASRLGANKRQSPRLNGYTVRETFDGLDYIAAIQIGRLALEQYRHAPGAPVNAELAHESLKDQSTAEFVSRIHSALTTSGAHA